MENMFSINDVFTKMFPVLEGISWDVGTALTGILFLGLLLVGFDYVRSMLQSRYTTIQHNNWADRFSEAADEALETRNGFGRNSREWLEHDMIYKDLVRRSARSRVKGMKW